MTFAYISVSRHDLFLHGHILYTYQTFSYYLIQEMRCYDINDNSFLNQIIFKIIPFTCLCHGLFLRSINVHSHVRAIVSHRQMVPHVFRSLRQKLKTILIQIMSLNKNIT